MGSANKIGVSNVVMTPLDAMAEGAEYTRCNFIAQLRDKKGKNKKGSKRDK